MTNTTTAQASLEVSSIKSRMSQLSRFHTIRNMATLGIPFIILLYLVLAEAFLEFRANSRGWETILFGRPMAVQRISGGGAIPIYGPTKDFPFRCPVIPVSKKEGMKRLWIASSSYGVADSLPAPDIFPNKIPTFLRQQGISSEIINASRIGADIGVNNADLKRSGLEWKPDYAVLYEMSNDIVSLSKRFLSQSTTTGKGIGSEGSAHVPTRFQNIGRFLEGTTIYAHLQSQIRSRLAANRILFDSIGLEAEQAFEDSVRDFLSLCKNLNARPVLCTFAISHSTKDIADWPGDLCRYNIFLSAKGVASALNRFNTIIKSLAKENHAILVDIDNMAGGQRNYFRDFVHFTITGHERVAHAIAGALAADIQTGLPSEREPVTK